MSLATRLASLATRIATEIKNHINDTTDAHDASAISITPITELGATNNVQSAIQALTTNEVFLGGMIGDHIGATTGAHPGSAISLSGGTSNITGADVQAIVYSVDASIGGLNAIVGTALQPGDLGDIDQVIVVADADWPPAGAADGDRTLYLHLAAP